MNKKILIEKILETENLTDELDDANASWLLDWGQTRANEILTGINEDAIAGSKINDLMAIMRNLNHIIGSYTTDSLTEVADSLMHLHDLFIKSFPGNPAAAVPPNNVLFQAVASYIKKESAHQALEYLAQWPQWLSTTPEN